MFRAFSCGKLFFYTHYNPISEAFKTPNGEEHQEKSPIRLSTEHFEQPSEYEARRQIVESQRETDTIEEKDEIFLARVTY